MHAMIPKRREKREMTDVTLSPAESEAELRSLISLAPRVTVNFKRLDVRQVGLNGLLLAIVVPPE